MALVGLWGAVPFQPCLALPCPYSIHHHHHHHHHHICVFIINYYCFYCAGLKSKEPMLRMSPPPSSWLPLPDTWRSLARLNCPSGLTLLRLELTRSYLLMMLTGTMSEPVRLNLVSSPQVWLLGSLFSITTSLHRQKALSSRRNWYWYLKASLWRTQG